MLPDIGAQYSLESARPSRVSCYWCGNYSPAPQGRATSLLCPRGIRERYNQSVPRKRKNKIGYCTYCGECRALTRDHVPPRSLFSGRPDDLITVPSCYFCNRGASKHDEYFNLVVKLGIDRNRFPKENADGLDTINNLARPESLGFARFLLQRYQTNPSRFVVDRDRVGIVLRRILRGLSTARLDYVYPNSCPSSLSRLRISQERRLR
jgi:5-methylcytosine-specific restriction endonuclease McrA